MECSWSNDTTINWSWKRPLRSRTSSQPNLGDDRFPICDESVARGFCPRITTVPGPYTIPGRVTINIADPSRGLKGKTRGIIMQKEDAADNVRTLFRWRILDNRREVILRGKPIGFFFSSAAWTKNTHIGKKSSITIFRHRCNERFSITVTMAKTNEKKEENKAPGRDGTGSVIVHIWRSPYDDRNFDLCRRLALSFVPGQWSPMNY